MRTFRSALASLALIAAPAAVQAGQIAFHCDIAQGYSCFRGQCKEVSQTVQPARYRFVLDVEGGEGQFFSCPGDRCGKAYPVSVVQQGDKIAAIYAPSPEIFIFNRSFSSYAYRWPPKDENDTEGRHQGFCARD